MAAGSRNRIRASLLRTGPARAAAYPRKRNTAPRNRNLAEALRSYNAALDEDPENPYAWNNKGFVLEVLGRGLEAPRCLENAPELNPGFATARVLLEQTQGVA